MFEFREEWLRPGASVPLDPQTLMACLGEIHRLRTIGEPGAINLVLGEDGVWAAPASV